MPRTIGDIARKWMANTRKLPALRRILRSSWAAPFVASVAQWLPPSDPGYETWIAARIRERTSLYRHHPSPGLFSLLTPVWNTSPQYLQELASSILSQDAPECFEWIVLDNGSTKSATQRVLKNAIEPDSRVRLFRSPKNLGIVAGMRYCLERACGRYVVAIDHDDRIDPDCLRVLAHHIRRFHEPPLLYSDEDRLCGQKRLLPYIKPDWDPLLFLNSAYTAHVGVLDRELSLQLDVYGDSATNSCPDWDAFLRFMQAGYEPQHVPEILYSWRMHPGSTSANMHSKNDVAASHRAMLNRYLQNLSCSNNFQLKLSPLFGGTPDWWFRRRQIQPRPLLLVSLVAGVDGRPNSTAAVAGSYPCEEVITLPRNAHPLVLARSVQDIASRGGMVAFVDDQLQILDADWAWEALGMVERHPDIAIIGGRIVDDRRRIVEAGAAFGFGDGCSHPDRGRAIGDPGYFHRTWKQHSVDAVSSRFIVIDAGFLAEFLNGAHMNCRTLRGLGYWASAEAALLGRRVAYSPFLVAQESTTGEEWFAGSERREFLGRHRELLSNSRYYSAALDDDHRHAYQLRTQRTPAAESTEQACRV